MWKSAQSKDRKRMSALEEANHNLTVRATRAEFQVDMLKRGRKADERRLKAVEEQVASLKSKV